MKRSRAIDINQCAKEAIMAIPKPTNDYAGELTGKFTAEPESTVLVLIDLQYASACRTTGLGRKMSEEKKEDIVEWRFNRIEKSVIPNVQRLLSFFRQHKLKVLYVTAGSAMPDYSDTPPHMKGLFKATNNYEGTREHEILDEIKPAEGEYIINKNTLSAFWSSGIQSLLRSLGAEYLLFAGVSTNMCVEGTARDAGDIGYKCVMVEDALAASQEELHRTALINFQRFYGRVASTDEILRELGQGL
jgi:nicotinamidase-related amidase